MTDVETDPLEPGSAAWWAAYGDRLARRRPRAGGLTVEQILDEAIDLLDEGGLEGLTVRALTARLGTSSASLYRHVASVEELLVLVVDRVIGEVELPTPDIGARESVIALALELRRVLRRHPGSVPALRAAPLLGPNALNGGASGLAALIDCGLEPDEALSAYVGLIDYVLGSVFFDTASIGDRARDAAEGPVVFETETIGVFEHVDSDQVFRRVVDAFLDGFGA